MHCLLAVAVIINLHYIETLLLLLTSEACRDYAFAEGVVSALSSLIAYCTMGDFTF